jgi:uncharacterized protein YdhG (YjbR/CyaY superfamily)
MRTSAESVDDYLAQLPPPQSAALATLRARIREIAPTAVEVIAYGMPGYRLHGRPLLYFGAAKAHCALYPGNGTLIADIAEELAGFSVSKGAIRFTPEHPLPVQLVDRIIRMRVKQADAMTAPRARGASTPRKRSRQKPA